MSAIETSISHIPTHVAIIMDGNGRWARQRGLTRIEGHRAGAENIRQVIEIFANHNVKYLTLYAFSTENLRRPKIEVKGLFHLLGEVIDRETQSLHRNGIHIRHLGRLDILSPTLQRRVLKAIELTKDNTTMTLSLAFNYGGRAEILDAVRRLVSDNIPPDHIDELMFSKYLYTSDLPDPDLVIRTAGEMRLSNFLLWQTAYSTTPLPPYGLTLPGRRLRGLLSLIASVSAVSGGWS